jgi:CcmD family protein
MPKVFLRFSFLIMSMVLSVIAQAQDSLSREKPQMAGLMRSNGKIYVVVTVLVIILAGLFIYLVHLDRKLSRLEKHIK